MKVGDLIRFKSTRAVGMIILPTLPTVNDQEWVSVVCSKNDSRGYRFVITDFLLEYLKNCAEVINESR